MKQSRIPCPFASRLSWEVFIAQQQQQDPRDFIKCLRMSIEAFEHLHSLLEVKLQKNKTMGDLRGGLIGSRLQLYLTIQYLGGSSIHDIHRNIGISKPMSYTIIREVCVAMTQCPALRIWFPSSEDECREAARHFEEISFGNAIGNCICVFDGYLLHTEQPRKKMVGNQRLYYSGHNCKFSVNIQAACYHNSRFLYFALAGLGGMNNKTAIHHCALGRYIECLPSSYAAIGDVAYEPTEQVTPIFYRVNWLDPLHDNFNYFASQLCICIEMAFGLMQMKWHYLLQPRQVTTHLPHYIMGIAFLHNFVVNYHLQNRDVDSDIFQGLQDDTTTTEGRMPPHNQRTEMAILSCMMIMGRHTDCTLVEEYRCSVIEWPSKSVNWAYSDQSIAEETMMTMNNRNSLNYSTNTFLG